MKKTKYDVLIVGAGPAGIFSCYELLNKNPKIKIGLIDMGNRIEKRKTNEVMSGFGGAGTYSDGKLHFTPKLSHERVFHLISPSDYQKLLDRIEEIFTEFGVDAETYPKNPDVVKQISDDAQKKDIELIVRKAKHVGTDSLKKVMVNFQNYLEKRGVDILDKVEVKDIKVKNNKYTAVITNKGDIMSNYVILCPGRVRAKWLQDLGKKHGIQYMFDMVEVGVRVEFPSSVMKYLADTLYEIVFKIRTSTFDDVIRTFCSCPNGMVATEKYEDHVCVNGHSNSDHNSENSNFAFLVEVNLTEPVENSIQYAQSIAQLASTIGGGKPILQRLADLRKGRRSTWSRLSKSMVVPSLKDVTPGDISMALPHRIVTDILEGLEKLDKVMPGINSGSTLLYAPEVKFRSSKVKTTQDMETSVKGVYVAGDASGMSGTITGAAATGIMAAKGILKNINKKK
ncbi:MAG TPA: FAD-dependent oxidoreductase [bacterium]|nr:FAD-dependent oxidoreductase [bacterium]